MQDHRNPPFNFVLTAMVFEATLAMVALAVGAVLEISPVETLSGKLGIGAFAAFFVGLLATAPLVVGFIWLHRRPFGPFIALKEIVEDRLVPLFVEADLSQLAMLSFAAGRGEELLFRGLIQEGLASRIGGPIGILVGLLLASLMFGLCHAMTKSYFWMATVLGFFLGVLFLVTGNLLAPITAHAIYDLFAMLYLIRHAASSSSRRLV